MKKNIQNYLERKFPKNTEKIKITIDEMEGNLIIKDYLNLQNIKISSTPSPSFEEGNIPNITLENLPNLKEVIIFVCQMENLEVNNCPLINSLRLRNNKLHNLNFLNSLTNPENLTYLSIADNRIIGQSLQDFSKLVNLETLTIGNESERGNNFYGSLIHLKDLNQLKTLDISYTDIDANELDSLPLSIERIICQSNKDGQHQCYEVEKKLKEGWRDASLEIKKNKEIFSVESNSIKEIEKEVSKLIGELNEKYGRSKIEEFFARNFYQRLDKDQIKELKNKEIDIQNISKNRIIYNNYFQGNNIYNHQQNNYVQVYQQILSEANHQISQSLAKSTISPQEKKIINQTIIYLGTKEIFLNYRQEIITDLINSYCRLVSKNKFGKFANHATQLMNISSKLAGAIPGGTVAQSPLGSLGIIISLAQATSQEKDLKKYLKKLQEIFDKDQEALDLFDDSYRSLTDSIQFNNPSEITKNIINTLNLDHTQLKPFGNDQNIYKLSGFWKQRILNLNLEELKILLENLEQKLVNSQQEFQFQRKELAQQDWFKIIDQNTDLLRDNEVNQLESKIENLVK